MSAFTLSFVGFVLVLIMGMLVKFQRHTFRVPAWTQTVWRSVFTLTPPPLPTEPPVFPIMGTGAVTIVEEPLVSTNSPEPAVAPTSLTPAASNGWEPGPAPAKKPRKPRTKKPTMKTPTTKKPRSVRSTRTV